MPWLRQAAAVPFEAQDEPMQTVLGKDTETRKEREKEGGIKMRLKCARKGCGATLFELYSPPEGAVDHVVYVVCEKCRKLYHLTSITGQVLRDLALRQEKEDK